MGLMKHDYMWKNQKRNNSSKRKWSDGLDSKKNFEHELNRMCNEKHQLKEFKKSAFNHNIKPHIVYMDENGNISKKKNSYLSNEGKKTFEQLQKEAKNKYVRNKILNILIVFIIIFLILYLCYDLYMSSIMIF